MKPVLPQPARIKTLEKVIAEKFNGMDHTASMAATLNEKFEGLSQRLDSVEVNAAKDITQPAGSAQCDRLAVEVASLQSVLATAMTKLQSQDSELAQLRQCCTRYEQDQATLKAEMADLRELMTAGASAPNALVTAAAILPVSSEESESNVMERVSFAASTGDSPKPGHPYTAQQHLVRPVAIDSFTVGSVRGL
jgi:chromosome segregation ATPase